MTPMDLRARIHLQVNIPSTLNLVEINIVSTPANNKNLFHNNISLKILNQQTKVSHRAHWLRTILQNNNMVINYSMNNWM